MSRDSGYGFETHPRTYFPDEVDIEKLMQEMPKLKVKVTPFPRDPTIAEYTFEHSGVQYEFKVCKIGPCLRDGAHVPENEVLTIYAKCGPGVKTVVKAGDARRILKQSPIRIEDLVLDTPCK